MGDDVIIGYDGKPRCAWAGVGDTAFGRYHDEVWGTRTDDEPALFEALTLGLFEAGLSWSVVFGKRHAFRAAFHGFDAEKVAAMGTRETRRNSGAGVASDPMRPRSSMRSGVWGVLALAAVLSPFLWLAMWPHGHPVTSWIAISFLVLVGLLAMLRASTSRGPARSRRR
jgi:hypothetical protein